MKLIDKKNISFDNGYLLDKKGNVLNTYGLVGDVNRFARLMRLAGFVKRHDVASVLARKVPHYEDVKVPAIVIPEPETPNVDEQVERTLSILEEHGKLKANAKAQDLLDSFVNLAAFVTEDSIAVEYDQAVDSKMEINPLELTEEIMIHYCQYMADNEDAVQAVL